MRKIRHNLTRRKKPNTNSGWYHYIDAELGSVWSGVKYNGNGILVRKILYTVRYPKYRYRIGSDEMKSKRFIKCGKYFEYMRDEWGVSKMIHGIKRNFKFRDRIENRWRDEQN